MQPAASQRSRNIIENDARLAATRAFNVGVIFPVDSSET